MGIPLTDNIINFEDLMVLAMNYGRVFPTGIPEEGIPSETIGDRAVLSLDWDGAYPSAGEEVAIDLTLRGTDGMAKGVSSVVTFEPGHLEFVSAAQGENACELVETFFFAAEEATGRLRVDFAVLGPETTMPGSFGVATLRFRVVSDELPAMGIDEVALRDLWNSEMPCLVSGTDFAGDGETPLSLRLGQNVPNPFNPRTAIAFDLPDRCGVTLRVYGVDGRVVATLVDETRGAGAYEVIWNGTDDRGRSAASGVYFYVLEASDLRLTQKMVLMR